jgi:uncharacterized protein (PEP-CTERM system associated)
MSGSASARDVSLLFVLLTVISGGNVCAQQQAQPQNSLPQATPAVDERDGREARASVRRSLAPKTGVAPSRALQITPVLNTRVTWTDNARGSPDKTHDWVGEIAPGVKISSERGRFVGMFDASLRAIGYVRTDDLSETFVEVDGSGSLEALENMLFLDLDANVNRNDHSPFYGRTGNNNLSTDRKDELRSWAVGPRLKFHLGNAADATLQYRSSWLDHKQLTYGKQHSQAWAGELGKPTATRYVGWNLEYTHSKTDYETSNREDLRRLGRATLFFNLSPRFRVRATGGHEYTDYGGVSKKDRGAFWGGGFDWNPTPRTTVSALSEDRPTGSTYNVSLSHRIHHAVFSVSGVRDLTQSTDTLGIYQNPDYRVRYESLANIMPNADPNLLRQMALSLMPEAGRDFITNAYYLNKTWNAGVTFSGRRDTLTLSAQTSRRERVGNEGFAGLPADIDIIDTNSASITYTHQLTPLTALNSMVMYTRSKSDGGTYDLDTRRTSASLGVTTQLGLRTRVGLTYFHQRTDSDAVPSSLSSTYGDYTENSVTANLGASF